MLRAAGADAPVWLDTDTRIAPESFDHCLLATGGVLSAVDAVAMEAYHRPDSLFTLTRPPGHHTGPDRAMGFCLLNHVSIAARYAQATYGFERVAILDWDVHHGNGTQDIHWRIRLSCSCRCTSGRCIPAPDGSTRSARATGWGAPSTCRCPRGRATASTSRCSTGLRCRSSRRSPRSC